MRAQASGKRSAIAFVVAGVPIAIPADKTYGWRVEEEFIGAIRGQEQVRRTSEEVMRLDMLLMQIGLVARNKRRTVLLFIVVFGVACWHLVRGRNQELFRHAAKLALIVGVPISALNLGVGAISALGIGGLHIVDIGGCDALLIVGLVTEVGARGRIRRGLARSPDAVRSVSFVLRDPSGVAVFESNTLYDDTTIVSVGSVRSTFTFRWLGNILSYPPTDKW